MNLFLDAQLIRERLEEARALAAHQALVRSLRPAGRPARVVMGLALIRIGHWMAGRAPRRAGAPRRAAA